MNLCSLRVVLGDNCRCGFTTWHFIPRHPQQYKDSATNVKTNTKRVSVETKVIVRVDANDLCSHSYTKDSALIITLVSTGTRDT